MHTTTWKCEVCGYVHSGHAPPDTCPVCGVGSDMFSRFEAVAPAPAPSPTTRSHDWSCVICEHVQPSVLPPDKCPVCGADKAMFEPHEPTKISAVSWLKRRVLIVGGGIAGLTAAESARKLSPDAAITIVTDEPGLPYYRLNLTRLLAGHITEQSLAMKSDGWFRDHQIELVHGDVVTIERHRAEAHLSQGQVLRYDRLILCNGAHAFVPPIAGSDRAGVMVLRTLADTRALLRHATAGARCVCIGGGLLGLEAAGALARVGLHVTVLEGYWWLLPRQLAEPAGQLLGKYVESLGIGVRCGVRVEEIVGHDRVTGVRLRGDEVIPADFVVLSTGVRPNTHLARKSGLQVQNGVVVNDRMVTSDPAIFAAGDVAEHRGTVYGIWPAAYAQGIVAGTNAVGGEVEFRGLAPSNRLKVLDVDLFSIGEFHPQDASYQVWEREDAGRYVRLVCRDGRLVGANLYGDTASATTVRDAIERGTQLAESVELRTEFPEFAQALCKPS